MADAQDVRRALDGIRALDRGLSVFGAETHLWRAAPPLTEQELRKLETALGFVIPAGYREYLRDVSCGGAGPLFGLRRFVAPPPGREGELLCKEFPGLEEVHRQFKKNGVAFSDG